VSMATFMRRLELVYKVNLKRSEGMEG